MYLVNLGGRNNIELSSYTWSHAAERARRHITLKPVICNKYYSVV